MGTESRWTRLVCASGFCAAADFYLIGWFFFFASEKLDFAFSCPETPGSRFIFRDIFRTFCRQAEHFPDRMKRDLTGVCVSFFALSFHLGGLDGMILCRKEAAVRGGELV